MGCELGVARHLHDRGHGQDRVAQPGRSAEHDPPQPLKAHRRRWGRCGRARAVLDEAQILQYGEQIGHVDALPVRLLVAYGGLPRGDAVRQHAHQLGAVRGEHRVGLHLGAADRDLVALVQVDQRLQEERQVEVETGTDDDAVDGDGHVDSSGRQDSRIWCGSGRDVPAGPTCTAPGRALEGPPTAERVGVQRRGSAGQADQSGLADDDLLHCGHPLRFR